MQLYCKMKEIIMFHVKHWFHGIKKRCLFRKFFIKRIVSRETNNFEQQIRSLKINSLKVIEKHNKNSGLFHVKQPQLPLLLIQVF